jgi:hypothetical protein
LVIFTSLAAAVRGSESQRQAVGTVLFCRQYPLVPTD